MNQFIRFAKDASSERLQQVWGRVLAGEIVRPGSFSQHTPRFVAELDKETADSCQRVGRHLVRNWLLKSDNWNEGHRYLVSVDLQRLGMMEGVGIGGPQQNFVLDTIGKIGIAGKSWGIPIRGIPGTKVSFPVFILTRMGQEVMSLLNVADEVQSLREIADIVDKSGIAWTGLGQVTRIAGNQVIFESTLQPIWQIVGQPQTAQNGLGSHGSA